VQHKVAKDIKEALKMASFLFKKVFRPKISLRLSYKKTTRFKSSLETGCQSIKIVQLSVLLIYDQGQ